MLNEHNFKGYLIYSSLSLRLLPLLPTLLRPLSLPLGIDLRGERILKRECYTIAHEYQGRQSQASRLSEPQRRTHEAHDAAPVHRRAGHVEGKPRHDVVHEDAEVVAQICARDPERPHATQHEHIAAY